jgi:hypothetical protein
MNTHSLRRWPEIPLIRVYVGDLSLVGRGVKKRRRIPKPPVDELVIGIDNPLFIDHGIEDSELEFDRRDIWAGRIRRHSMTGDAVLGDFGEMRRTVRALSIQPICAIFR